MHRRLAFASRSMDCGGPWVKGYCLEFFSSDSPLDACICTLVVWFKGKNDEYIHNLYSSFPWEAWISLISQKVLNALWYNFRTHVYSVFAREKTVINQRKKGNNLYYVWGLYILCISGTSAHYIRLYWVENSKTRFQILLFTLMSLCLCHSGLMTPHVLQFLITLVQNGLRASHFQRLFFKHRGLLW